MEVLEASMNGTVRIILVLLAVWWVLRMVQRRREGREGTHRVPPHRRSKGDMRVERTAPRAARGNTASNPHRNITVTDADYEEIGRPS